MQRYLIERQKKSVKEAISVCCFSSALKKSSILGIRYFYDENSSLYLKDDLIFAGDNLIALESLSKMCNFSEMCN